MLVTVIELLFGKARAAQLDPPSEMEVERIQLRSATMLGQEYTAPPIACDFALEP
jgi:hypothetical protein